MVFTDFNNKKQFLRYIRSKWEATIGSFWEGQTKIAKKDYFTKNLYSLTFFEINTSNFQDMLFKVLQNFVRKNVLKIKKIKL